MRMMRPSSLSATTTLSNISSRMSSKSKYNANDAFLTLSFSGAGHLLSYHLGVANVLLQHFQGSLPRRKEGNDNNNKNNNHIIKIRAVAGSSSGAIVATLLSIVPHRLDDYTHRFLNDGGNAHQHLTDILTEEFIMTSSFSANDSDNENYDDDDTGVDLFVNTTRCNDGSSCLFSFHSGDVAKKNDITTTRTTLYDILLAVKASCKIPSSFHPIDIFSSSFSSSSNQNDIQREETEDVNTTKSNDVNIGHNLFWQPIAQPIRTMMTMIMPTNNSLYYPNNEGVEINGSYYVDGGISSLVPGTPYDWNENCIASIVVSPFSGSLIEDNNDDNDDNEHNKHHTSYNKKRQRRRRRLSIRPSVHDDSDTNSFTANLTLPGGDWITRCGTFAIRPSLSNLRSSIIALGFTSTPVLQQWYQHGMNDATKFIKETKL